MHIRYNANIDNKTYVGERDLQKVIGCLLTYGNQFIRHNWKPFASKFWNSNSTEFYTILKLSALMIPMVPLNNKKRFHDTSSSMEFHGTSSAPISMARAVPWNSMELQVRQFRWHEKFHGIPWNSLELGVRQFRWNEKFHGIPWKSMELRMRQFRWHE